MESQNKAFFSKEAAWLLALAMLASVVYHFAHPFFLSPDYLHLPGVGLAVTQWVLLGGCLLCAIREKRLRITRGGVLLAGSPLPMWETGLTQTGTRSGWRACC